MPRPPYAAGPFHLGDRILVGGDNMFRDIIGLGPVWAELVTICGTRSEKIHTATLLDGHKRGFIEVVVRFPTCKRES